MKFRIIFTLIFITPLVASAQIKDMNTIEKSERYQRGWNKLQEIDGEAGENVVNGLKNISPELSQFIIEYSFGDVYSLDKLDNKSKEIAAVSSLIAQGAIPQLKVHLNGALNTGSSVNEVKEVILQMSAYAGFPKAINAMNAFKEVLNERKEKSIVDSIGQQPTPNNEDRRKTGSKALASLDSNQEQLIIDTYDNFSPELTRFVIEYGYGDIYSRDNIDKKLRQTASIAALTTLGNAPSQLKFHINGGLNVGLTIDEIKGIMLLMTVYAGFPAAINGTNILKEVVAERNNK
ncbi:4-carboxymuconolactone decarboxylase [Dysgonomonas alginatilytica]|uniref:4-carboxymuconolactone decarboxylase n=1 Tax=Dysgonomonas alginatilytica TaxID=1605892 RepID=A0A2V3PTA9_9BACT|nr:carboxymuconolactone decarboxylase family protein [Dysgonomonas alginatilytica]PXV66771.1 4-carboxymuconolactone decarboxylase [Dysgonomonas alginatilytica]